MESMMFSLVLDFSEYWEWIVVLQVETSIDCKEKSLAETTKERFTLTDNNSAEKKVKIFCNSSTNSLEKIDREVPFHLRLEEKYSNVSKIASLFGIQKSTKDNAFTVLWFVEIKCNVDGTSLFLASVQLLFLWKLNLVRISSGVLFLVENLNGTWIC